jgi:hypothetical protein
VLGHAHRQHVAVEADRAGRQLGDGGHARPQALRGELPHEGTVLLQVLTDPLDLHAAPLGGGRGRQQRQGVEHRGGLATEGVEAGDGVAERRHRRVAEQGEQLALDGLAHDVLPAARLLVDVGVVQPDDVDQQALREPVLAHDRGGQLAPGLRQLQVPVALDGQQAVALHPGDRLADRRAALVQPLGDAGAEGDDPLLLQLEDRPEVHLRGVDEVVHWSPPCRP